MKPSPPARLRNDDRSIAPRRAWLSVGAQAVTWQELGRRDVTEGAVWLVLHGGPGSGAQPALAQALTPEVHRIVLPDQRGAGRSRPRGTTRRNSLSALVDDLERLREHLGVVRWSVLAGSWGTVLAVAYAARYPERVQRLVLRGAFGLRGGELAGVLTPQGANRRLLGGDVLGRVRAVRRVEACLHRAEQLLQSATLGVTGRTLLARWCWLEQQAALRGMQRSALRASRVPGDVMLAVAIRRQISALKRQQRQQWAAAQMNRGRASQRALWGKFRVQTHLLRRRVRLRAGLNTDLAVLSRTALPVDWIHGRFDGVCPPRNSVHAFAAREAVLPGLTRLFRPVAGHLGGEPAMLLALRQAVGGTWS